ncbi:MAG TPA: Uma2 family endonuclease [Lacipirellulaceae bacterium]|nr:Uma2 family endonuclease [Lacipirellulaceae bacterium]
MKFQTAFEIEYPETDGRPMGETDLHRDWMHWIIDLLKFRYRGQQVYVSGNLLLYYEEGDPSHFVVPDAMVVKDCPPYRRRIFKVWEEQRVPNVVVETTSRSTKHEDTSFKTQLYEQLGVREYFLYDPTADYLRPPLQGWRLGKDRFERITADAAGRLGSEELGLQLQLEDGDLVMYDARSGDRLLTEAEANQAAYEAERAARERAEAEIRRLQQKLHDRGISD